MTRSSAALAALVLVPLIGCDPYDPGLGQRPFRCNSSEPRCPDHYVCVEITPTEGFCELEDTVPPGVDGEPTCGNDTSLEPNENIGDPTDLPIPSGGDTYSIANLTICPAADVDVYRFAIDTTGKSARVQVMYDSAGGPLEVELLNSTGVTIRTATPTGGNDDLLRADFANLAAGTYFGRVRGDQRTTYDLDVVTAAGALPP